MEHWRIEMFGGLVARRGPEVITRFGGLPYAGLLARLAFRAGTPQSREALIESLWPEVDPAVGRNRLSTGLSLLRRVLEPGDRRGSILVADQAFLRIPAGAIETDVADFEAALLRARRSEGADRAGALLDAISLCQGELLPEQEAEWITAERLRFSAAFLGACRDLSRIRLQDGDSGGAIDILLRATAAVPDAEDAALSLLELFGRSGRGAEGRAWYESWEQLFRDRVGRLPGSALREAWRALVPGTPDSSVRPAAPLELPSGPGAWAVARGPLERAEGIAWFRQSGDVACTLGRRLLPLVQALLSAIDEGGTAVVDLVEEVPAVGEDAAGRLLPLLPSGCLVLLEAAGAMLRRGPAPGRPVLDLGEHALGHGPPERIFALLAPGTEPPDLELRPRRLPAPRSRLLGRASEQAVLLEALKSGERLLVLTGPPGVGKTRLATELALLRHQAGVPVIFAELGGLKDAARLEAELARAAELQPGPGPVADRLGLRTGGQPALLVLDDIEAPVEIAGPWLESLLAASPRLQVLVTSRHAPDLVGERVLPVEPWPAPPASASLEELCTNPAMAFFLDRARALRPYFALSAETAPAVADICRRLDGLPLAIELAAGRLAGLSPLRIREGLDHRFELLVDRRRSGRHRSLEAAISASLDGIGPQLLALLEGLSVLPGDIYASAAEAILEEPLAADLLEELRAASLVLRVSEEDGGRYGLLDSIRAFLQPRVPEDRRARIEARLRDFFLEGLNRPGRAGGLDRDWAHLRHLLQVLPPAEAIRLMDRLHQLGAPFWRHLDLLRRAEELLADPAAGLDLEQRVQLHSLARFDAMLVGDAGRRARHQAALVELADADLPPLARRRVLFGLAQHLSDGGELDAAARIAEQAVAHCRSLDLVSLASALAIAARVYLLLGDPERSIAAREESLATWIAHGNEEHVLRAVTSGANALLGLGRPEPATRLMATVFSPEIERQHALSLGLNRGALAICQGAYTLARKELDLAHHRLREQPSFLFHGLLLLFEGWLAVATGDPGAVALSLDASLSLLQEKAGPIDRAWTLAALGWALVGHRTARARPLLVEAAAVAARSGSALVAFTALDAWAHLLLRLDRPAEAAACLAAGDALRAERGVPRTWERRPVEIDRARLKGQAVEDIGWRELLGRLGG